MIETQNPEFLNLLLPVPQSQIDPRVLALPHLHGNTIGFPRVLIEDMSCLHTQVFFDCCGLSFRQSSIPYFDDYRRILLVSTPHWQCNYWLSDQGMPEPPMLYIAPFPTRLTQFQWQEMRHLFSEPFNVMETECNQDTKSPFLDRHETFAYNTEDACYTVYRHSRSHTDETIDYEFIVLESNVGWVHQGTEFAFPAVHYAPPPESFHLFQGPKSEKYGREEPLDPDCVYTFPCLAAIYGPWHFECRFNVAVGLYEDLRQRYKEEIDKMLERASKGGRVSV